jgi:beta-lactam-binding protein with PASTA domain
LIATKQDQNCLVFNWFCNNNGNGGGNGETQVTVPNVIGLNAKDARRTLHNAGLNVNTTGSNNGTVRAQNPGAGSNVGRGSTITIFAAF